MSKHQSTSQLATLQQWMQAVITHPHGVEAGLRSESARAHLDVSLETLQQVVLPSHRMTSADRLRIYANAYFARLLECLQEEFPAVAHAVGAEAFATFVWGYLQAYPSQSYTLSQLGRNFPMFLQETRPPRDVNASVDEMDFVIDLARVERLYSEVFDGPGVENKRTLQPEDLAALAPDQWLQTRLIPVPCLRLVEAAFPVHEYISGVRQRREIAFPSPQPTYLAVTRRNFLVRRCPMTQAQFQLLSSLVGGATIGDALEEIASQACEDLEGLAAQIQIWFHDWAAAGYFQGVAVSPL